MKNTITFKSWPKCSQNHSVFDKLIWYTIGPERFLFGIAQFSLWASGTVNYDYIVTNSINCLLIGSKCIPNGAHTNHFWANLVRGLKYIKTSGSVLSYMSLFCYRTVSMSSWNCNNSEWPRHNCKTISSNSRCQFLIVEYIHNNYVY